MRSRIVIDDGIAYVAWLEERPPFTELTVRLSPRMLREVREGRAVRPVVGDLVTLSPEGQVEAVEPRRTRLARRAAGEKAVEQVMAANVDVAVIATTGADVSERRLERYLAIAREGGVEAAIVVTKADALDDREGLVARVASVAGDAPVLVASAVSGEGVDAVAALALPERTLALVGSSGVGKSTLLNRLMGADLQRVGGLQSDGRGKHTTTRRRLFALPGGGYVLDTPGMREVGLMGEPEEKRARR